MAVTRHTLTGDFGDIVGDEFAASSVKAYLSTNLPAGEAVIDLVANEIQVGAKLLTLSSSGVIVTGASPGISLIATDSADTNIDDDSLRYRVTFSYINVATRTRETWDSDYFELTADTNLAVIVGTILAPVTWRSAFIAEFEALAAAAVADAAAQVALAEDARDLAEQYRDEAHDISGIDTSDGVITAIDANPASAFRVQSDARQSASIDARGGRPWTPATFFAKGAIVTNPAGVVKVSNQDHTSAAAYATDAAKWDDVDVLFALLPKNEQRPVGEGFQMLTPDMFGAVGDWNGTTGTDDTAALTAAANALRVTKIHSGSYLQLPAGATYKANGLPCFAGLDVRAAAGEDAALVSTSPLVGLFSMTTNVYGMHFQGIKLSSVTGGHLFEMAANVSTSGNMFDRVTFYQSNTAKSVFSGTNIGAFIQNVFKDCTFQHSLSATVPTIDLRSNNGGLNCNQFIRCLFRYSGNYSIWLESISLSNWAYDNLIQDCLFEVCDGGLINLLSVNNTSIIRAFAYDFSGATTKDLIHIGKTAGGLKSKLTRIESFGRRGGTLGSGLYDIKLEGAGAAVTSVIDCDTGTGSGFSIYWGFEQGYFRGLSGVTHTADDSVEKHIHGAEAVREVKLPAVTGINAKTVAVTDLYTVPTGKKFMVTKVVVRNTAISTPSGAPTVGVGSDAGGTNIFAATALTGLNNTTTAGAWVFEATGLRPIVPAAGVVRLGITGASTASSQTLAVDVFGYLFT